MVATDPVGYARADWDPREPPRVPAGSRVYAIGDIHGRADLLSIMLRHIEADLGGRPAQRPTIVCVGDYVDRGPDSRGVVDLLLRVAPRAARCVFLRGNHEDILVHFLADPVANARRWLANGGNATLKSYGVTLSEHEDLVAAGARFERALGPAHRAFFRGLRTLFECGDYLFVHAGLKPQRPLAEQRQDDLLWIRDEFLNHPGPFPKYVVHGHTPHDQPELLRYRADIDTGAFATGRLTCLVLEGEDRRLITAEAPSTAA